MRAPAALLLILLTSCGEMVAEPPTMAPVDHPRPPKGIATACDGVAWEPITLPTTAAEQAAGRQRDRKAADDAIETCDGRRARAVEYGRRLGAGL